MPPNSVTALSVDQTRPAHKRLSSSIGKLYKTTLYRFNLKIILIYFINSLLIKVTPGPTPSAYYPSSGVSSHPGSAPPPPRYSPYPPMPLSKPTLVANNASADQSNVGRNLQQLIAWNNAIQQHHQQQQQHMPVDQSTNPYLAMAVLNFPHLIQQQQQHINKLNNQVIKIFKI